MDLRTHFWNRLKIIASTHLIHYRTNSWSGRVLLCESILGPLSIKSRDSLISL